MKQEWIEGYAQHVSDGDLFELEGQTSCSQHLKIGLGFAFGGSNAEMTPVLFIYTIQNWAAYQGVRLNNEAFSAYPYEQEVLLKEGCFVYALKIDEIVIKNKHDDFTEYNGKTVTVIYLVHPF